MNKGFTLVELSVTIGITVIISILILADFPEFTRRLELSRTVQAVAVSFREAESSALAVREFKPDSISYFPAYGLHFENPPLTTYFLFADLNNNRVYDAGEKADEFQINGQPRVSRLCGGTRSSPPGRCDLTRLDVVFVRPNPDIFINSDKGSFSDAEAVLLLPDGQEKKVVIWSTGQLAIE